MRDQFHSSETEWTVGIVEILSTLDTSRRDLKVGIVQISSIVVTSETELMVGSAEISSLDSAETLGKCSLRKTLALIDPSDQALGVP